MDDDGNGHVDDVHGPAYDVRGEKTTGVLFPLSYGEEEEARYRRLLKGYMDLQAALDTPDASEFRRIAAAMKPQEYTPFVEGLMQYGNYAHGTHVAGIASANNPAARILIGRISFDYHLVPLLPTVQLAEAFSRAYRETVDYFRKNEVRVVNMSWGATAECYETALEKNNAGGTAEERKALARRIFDIDAAGLREALASASEILFVAAAGNSDEDVEFIEDAPASFDPPNLISAAAVDRAGDEAAFTSYGKRVEVYANDYEVKSYVPGGEIHALSGTSMSAPQVVNLAAKLLAVYPKLIVAQLREAIVSGAEEKTIGEGKQIRLLHPKRSFEIAAEMSAEAE
jgi:subtilisin family serine protease